MINQKALKPGALISCQSDSVQEEIDDLISQGIVTPGKDISCVFLSTDQVLGVEELLVSSISDLINASWLKIDLNGTGNEFSSLYTSRQLELTPVSWKKV